MKKVWSILLIAVMLVSVFAVTVNATTLEEELSAQMFDYFEGDEFDLSYHPPELPYIILYDYVEVDDIVIFSVIATWRGVDMMEMVERYGDWCFYAGGCTYPSNVGMYVRADGEIYTLKEAWESGIVTDLSVTKDFSKYTKVYRVGDVDLDHEVSVIDATLIQRRVAQLGSISDIRIAETADVDDDGKVSVTDATIVQRQVAGLS